MKLQIDTTQKTIKLEESIKLDGLFDLLHEMFPDDKWKEFALLTNVTVQWVTNPIIIEPHYPYRYPWYQPYYTTGQIEDNKQYALAAGVYDIEINT